MSVAEKEIQNAINAVNSGKLLEAERLFKNVLKGHPKNIAALNLLTVVLMSMERYAEAEEFSSKAIRLNQGSDVSYYNYGLISKKLNKPQQALEQFNNALRLNAQVPETWNNRGTIFNDLEQYENAIQDFDRAISLALSYSDAFCNKGKSLSKLKRYDEALAAYDRALSIKPDLVNAWLGRGNLFYDLKRYDEAFAAYDKALAIKSDFADAWLGRGNVYYDLKRYDEALAAYDKALALKSDIAEACLGRGNVFLELKRYDEAITAYDKALTLNPDLVSAEGARLYSKMHLCNWDNFSSDYDHLIGSIKNKKENTHPFSFLGISSSAEEQHNCAKLWVQKQYPSSKEPLWKGQPYKHNKIRIGYVSADFRQHPVAYLIAGVFECHNKSQFEITAISIGPKDNSEMRRRLEVSFDKFVDAEYINSNDIAKKIREAEIDILIDLNGFTQNARTEVFAHRAAPIQVNYLGYLGTMGAKYIDYIIADQTVIPETQKQFYTEKIVYLPNSFQPTDWQRKTSEKMFMRAEVGLPQQGFVFCNFNTSYKITPNIFDIWMRILKQVNGSVLWLSAGSQTVKRNLRKEALARGVNAERLIFASTVPLSEHQARLRLADLFLDTLPYNAGATASDTLWAGIPVLTCIGQTFVGRMAASILKAISLPELITITLEAYEQMAMDLATHTEKLATIKRKLAENRLTTPLFDTKLFTKHIEAAYTAMYERHQKDLPPDHIVIPN